MLLERIKSLLAEPATRGLAIDDPATTSARRAIVIGKPFLRRIYEEWYDTIARALPGGPGGVVEIGSGAGFLDTRLPGVVTSEVFPCPDVDVVLDARALPFRAGALRAIVMTDVLHHLPDVRAFLRDATRCVRSGGRMVMIEPWVTSWSSWVYRKLHHEPFDPTAREWSFPASGPLSSANGALPWIVFERDAATFAAEFPEWRLVEKRLAMPLRYLLSGGVSMRSLVPGASFGMWTRIESLARPWMPRLAMFATIVLERS